MLKSIRCCSTMNYLEHKILVVGFNNHVKDTKSTSPSKDLSCLQFTFHLEEKMETKLGQCGLLQRTVQKK